MLKSSSQRAWLVAFAATIAFILINGYTFNSNNHEEHLPQVYQLINPSLYPHDYFVSAYHQTFSVRLVYVWLIYITQFVMPVSMAVFLFYLLCVTITAWVIQQLALFFYNNNLFAQSSAFVVLLLFDNYVVGDNALVNTELVSSTFATAMCSVAIYFLINKRWHLVAIFVGIASLFQVLVGLHMAGTITMLYILMFRSEMKPTAFVKYFFIYLLVASPMLFPLVFLQTIGHSASQDAEFYHILYYVRNPNHYLPSAYPMWDYIHFLSLTAIAFIIHFFVDERLKKVWRIVLFIILGGMIVYTTLLEVVGFMPVGKLQWFKTCSWAMVMDVLVIVYFLVQILSFKITLLKRIKVSSALLILSSIAGIIFITNSRYIPVRYFQNRYHVGNYIPGDAEKMHEWIRLNTPVDCLILTSPGDNSFLCEAQRSMPVGFKAIVHEPFFLIPWYKNFKNTFHNGEPFKGYFILQPAIEHYYLHPPLPSSKLHWDYRLTDLKKGTIIPERETIIHQENSLALVKVSDH